MAVSGIRVYAGGRGSSEQAQHPGKRSPNPVHGLSNVYSLERLMEVI